MRSASRRMAHEASAPIDEKAQPAAKRARGFGPALTAADVAFSFWENAYDRIFNHSAVRPSFIRTSTAHRAPAAMHAAIKAFMSKSFATPKMDEASGCRLRRPLLPNDTAALVAHER